MRRVGGGWLNQRVRGVSLGVWLLVGILVVGFFLRAYQPRQRFLYAHDSDLGAWIVKEMVVDKHLRLVGQMTSTQGVFIGPIYYYLLAGFYVLFGMDPVGGVAMVTVLGCVSLLSYYYVFRRVFDETAGLLAAFFYAFSFFVIYNDRSVVPVMPVLMWAVWWFYGVNLILRGEGGRAYVLLGGLAGLIWHLNLSLVLVFPVAVLAQILSRRKISARGVAGGAVLFILLNLPLMVFELRHNFVQTRGFVAAMRMEQGDIYKGVEKLNRVVFLTGENVNGIVWGGYGDRRTAGWAVGVMGALWLFLVLKKQLDVKLAVAMASWVVVYVGFFGAYSKVVSEYYLDGLTPIWIAMMVMVIKYWLDVGRRGSVLGWVGVGAVVVFGVINLQRFFGMNINRSGYVERRALVEFIREDVSGRGYPCVAISYITDPGYDLGYRYWFYRAGLKLKPPGGGAPVYSVVFPLSRVDRVDKTFGALGLVLPESSQYNKEEMEKVCAGEDDNLSRPMWGVD